MLYCDICKKEIEGRRDILRRHTLPYEFACSAWQTKEFDLCPDCERTLSYLLAQTKCDFANGKCEVMTNKQLYIAWDINKKADKEHTISLWAVDTDTNEKAMIFSTHELTGVQNIEELLRAKK